MTRSTFWANDRKMFELFLTSLMSNYLTYDMIPGGYSGFQVTGMITGFLEVENFDSGLFLGVGKFGKYFCGCLD